MIYSIFTGLECIFCSFIYIFQLNDNHNNNSSSACNKPLNSCICYKLFQQFLIMVFTASSITVTPPLVSIHFQCFPLPSKYAIIYQRRKFLLTLVSFFTNFSLCPYEYHVFLNSLLNMTHKPIKINIKYWCCIIFLYLLW